MSPVQPRRRRGTREGGQFAPSARPADVMAADDALTIPDSAPQQIIEGVTHQGIPVSWEQHGGVWSAAHSWDTTPMCVQLASAQDPQQASAIFDAAIEAVAWSEILAEAMTSGDLAPADAPAVIQKLSHPYKTTDAAGGPLDENPLNCVAYVARLSFYEHIADWRNGERTSPLAERLKQLLPCHQTKWEPGTPPERDHRSVAVLNHSTGCYNGAPHEWLNLKQEMTQAAAFRSTSLADGTTVLAVPSLETMSATTGIGSRYGNDDPATAARIYDRYMAEGAPREATATSSPPSSWAAWVMISKSHQLSADSAALSEWMQTTGPTRLRQCDWLSLLDHTAGRVAMDDPHPFGDPPDNTQAAAALAAAWHATTTTTEQLAPAHKATAQEALTMWLEGSYSLTTQGETDSESPHARASRLKQAIAPHTTAQSLTDRL